MALPSGSSGRLVQRDVLRMGNHTRVELVHSLLQLKSEPPDRHEEFVRGFVQVHGKRPGGMVELGGAM